MPTAEKISNFFAQWLLTCFDCGEYKPVTDEGGLPLAVLPFALVDFPILVVYRLGGFLPGFRFWHLRFCASVV